MAQDHFQTPPDLKKVYKIKWQGTPKYDMARGAMTWHGMHEAVLRFPDLHISRRAYGVGSASAHGCLWLQDVARHL